MIEIDRVAQEIADQLIGTAQSLASVLEFNDLEVLDNFQPFLLALDEKALECSQCNWWSAADEMHDHENGQDYVCQECHDESE